MSASVTLPSGVAVCHLPHPFPLAHGGALAAPHVAFELVGPPGAPVVAVLGGISAGRHVAAHDGDPRRGWWDGVVGPRCAVDTRRFRVLSIDWLGGVGESTRAEPGFPAVDVDDQARALGAVLDELGVPRLHAAIGASYGGMVALAFAVRFPRRLARLAVVAASHRSRPSATAWRALQRRIVRLGADAERPDEGLALARALAMATYRGAAGLDDRFAGAPARRDGRAVFPVEDWLVARGQGFARRFSADAFVALSESIDLCSVDATAIRTPATVVGIRGDRLVEPADVAALARALAGPVVHVELESVFGHDGFLKEVAALTPVLAAALRGGRPA